MRLTKEQVKNLPDGTFLKIILSGSSWDEEFGKVCNVIKEKDKLYHIKNFDYIEDIDSDDDLDITAIIYEKNL